MRAWLFQDSRQKKKLGEEKCPWSVGWYDPDSKKRCKRIGSKSMAEKFRKKKEGELAAGLCKTGPEHTRWESFVDDYKQVIMPKWRSSYSQTESNRALKLFGEIVKPVHVDRVDARSLDQYVAKRLLMRGKKPGSTVAAETVRKELRTIRAALSVAVRWKQLDQVPPMPEVDGFGKDKPFVTEQHFDAMMKSCDAARFPKEQLFEPKDFWKAFLAVAWVTGMRRSAMLALKWENVDLEAGVAISPHRDNKPKKDQRHQIGAAGPFLEQLLKVRKFGESRVFAWNHSTKSLDRDLARIQKEAGIHLTCLEEHDHTPSCHLYSFHSFRYAHATYNFGRVSDRDLQEQMGHASFNTTLRYIKYAEGHQKTAYDAYIPSSLKNRA